MFTRFRLLLLLAAGFYSGFATVPLVAAPSQGEPHFTGEELQEDAAVLHDAFVALQPGIYRYSAPQEFEARYSKLRNKLAEGMNLSHSFLEFTQFAAAIRCGHTWTNPLNQSDSVKDLLLERPDRLPLHFTVVGRRFLVTQALPGVDVVRGDEILAVDNIPVPNVIDRLWPYLRADGNSDGKRLAQLGHDAGQSAFDLYYSLLVPAPSGSRSLKVRGPRDDAAREVVVTLVNQKMRDTELAEQVDAPSQNWKYEVDGSVAVMTMPTWAFWNVKFDWADWLDHAFSDIEYRKVPYLIIDLRRNEGGDGAIGDDLLRRLTAQPISYAGYEKHLIYDVVPDRLRTYLSTWDRSFYDQRALEVARPGGGYKFKDGNSAVATIQPDRQPYQGRVFVLVGPTNSSATFEFAREVKETHLATLVGQPTGGNLRGLTGGEMFFLKLPHTGISLDIPVIAYEPAKRAPDSPVMPDISVAPDLETLAQGQDPEMQTIKRLIAGMQNQASIH